ncbi:MAG: hypothetical protein DHS20C17_33340 [Cyclobacteriaceae bacterium]|nr:MAG: hypothetical protein DHS20C17_33340 [Cyclobacteriaceae bacterium]
MMPNHSVFVFLFLLNLVCCKEIDIRQVDLELDRVPVSPELFAGHIVSTALYERDIAISTEGDMVIYTLGNYKQTRRCLVMIRKVEANWSEPEIVTLSGKHQDIEPFITPDGSRLYFASNRPIDGDTSRADYNIWFSDRVGDNWSNPVALDTLINTRGDEFYPSVSEDGDLYFTATREEGFGLEDIFHSTFVNGEFQKPVALDSTINSSRYEFNAYISPDEALIIFSSYGRQDGFGGGDLYYSTRNENGSWNKSINMGPAVNSAKLDYCPFVDWPRHNFYFTSERAAANRQPITSIDDLILESNSILNGYGNIYRVGFKYLALE